MDREWGLGVATKTLCRYASLKLRTLTHLHAVLACAASIPSFPPSLPPSLHAILPSFSAVAELRSCEVIADVCTRNPINELAVTTGDDDDDDRAVVLCSSSGSHFAVVVVVRFDGAVALYLLTERASDGFMVV